MNHTPGPWKVLNDSPPAVRSLNGSNVAPEVCSISDARLVAAAPELLAALYDALPYVEDVLSDPAQLACFKSGIVQRHAKAIRAAIAKAEGEQ
jgi:hypothetical protein